MILKKFLTPISALILLIPSLCSNHQKKIVSMRLSWKMPMLDKKLDTVFNMSDENNIYYYKDLVLYKKRDDFSRNNKWHTTFRYWMYKENSQKGVMYEQVVGGKGIQFDVDSFLVRNAFKGSPFYDAKNDSLVSSTKLVGKDRFIEKYVPRQKPDDSYPDTTTFFYDKKLSYIPYSFSVELDKRNKSKVVQVVGIYNPITDGKSKAQATGRIMMFRLDKSEVDDEKEKVALFNRFETDIK